MRGVCGLVEIQLVLVRGRTCRIKLQTGAYHSFQPSSFLIFCDPVNRSLFGKTIWAWWWLVEVRQTGVGGDCGLVGILLVLV